MPAFLEEIDTKAPNTIMEQALVLEGSLPPDGQTTGVGRLHLVFRIIKLPTRNALELRDCDTVMVKQDARQPFPFASRTRLYRTEKLTTVPPEVPASKPHLLKLVFLGSCIARIIGQRGQVINHIKETFKCTIFSTNQGVYVSGL